MKSGPHEEVLPNAVKKIADREDKYLKKKNLQKLSPERFDPFSEMDKTPDVNQRSYSEILAE